MNKKVIISLGMIILTAAIVVTGTRAFLSDTETSGGNTFTAGAIDLTIDNECHWNGQVCREYPESSGEYVWFDASGYPTGEPCSCSWTVADWQDGMAIFNFDDLKPGDEGEATISIHVDSNPAWICAEIVNVTDLDNGCNEPEFLAETALYGSGYETCNDATEGEGELWENLYFDIWMDTGDDEHMCNNIKDPEEDYLIQGASATDLEYPIVDSQHGGDPITEACIGVAWYIPGEVDNIAQTDSVTGDLVFEAVQARHNGNFLCTPPQEPECGNGTVESGEQCEPPSEGNSDDCSQLTSDCVGVKMGFRDAFGDCDADCGCVFDPFTDLVCDQICGASCDEDEDCGPNEECNMETCSCDDLTYCGDGIVQFPNQVGTGGPLNDGYEVCDGEAGVGEHQTCVNCAIVELTYCGDNIWQSPNDEGVYEECDGTDMDGYDPAQYTCSPDCIAEYTGFCGDGILNPALEECDDGNQSNNDYCNNSCQEQGALTVHKSIINDNGGNLTLGGVTLKVDGATVSDGQTVYLLPGAHTFAESPIYGYTPQYSSPCNSFGGVTIAAGETKSCTLTNNDVAPSLTIIKNVINGSAQPDDFQLSIDGYTALSGFTYVVDANHAYIIDEIMLPNYEFTEITGPDNCPSNPGETITLDLATNITCTITNTYGL